MHLSHVHAKNSAIALFLMLFTFAVYHFSISFPNLSVTVRKSSRFVHSIGIEGFVQPWDRWRDALATAMEPWAHGFSLKYTVRHALRSGPLSETYVSVLEQNVTESVRNGNANRRQDSAVAVDGFATVGRVNYKFQNFEDSTNTQGFSNQVLVACMCTSPTCVSSVLVRPVTESEELGTGFCLFERVNGKFSDCASELLRVSAPIDNSLPQSPSNRHSSWNYSVANERYAWEAEGNRSWVISCNDSEPSYVYDNVVRIWEQQEAHYADNANFSREVAGRRNERGSCAPPVNSALEYVRDVNETRNRQCYKSFRFAVSAASNRASQQDTLATGRDESTFTREKPNLISRSELFLFISSGFLALVFALQMLKDPYRLDSVSKRSILLVVIIVLVTCGIELTGLCVLLYWEQKAESWHTTFAFVDAGISWAQDYGIPTVDGADAKYSVMVITSVLGTATVRKTRFKIILGVLLVLIVLVLGTLCLTVLRLWRMQRLTTEQPFNQDPTEHPFNQDPTTTLDRCLEHLFPSDRDRARRKAEATTMLRETKSRAALRTVSVASN